MHLTVLLYNVDLKYPGILTWYSGCVLLFRCYKVDLKRAEVLQTHLVMNLYYPACGYAATDRYTKDTALL